MVTIIILWGLLLLFCENHLRISLIRRTTSSVFRCEKWSNWNNIYFKCSTRISKKGFAKRKQELWLLIPAAVWWEGVLPSSSSRPCCNGCLGYCEINSNGCLGYCEINTWQILNASSSTRLFIGQCRKSTTSMTVKKKKDHWWSKSCKPWWWQRLRHERVGDACHHLSK